ncbi:low affinity immunoglobulin gamma Fc region receptor II-like isoform X2 [Girardinichthys multiradiatus]|uniref:low affinity immunoglobulin gamma Fc region receptor II-like isoform X2 n=1 Tax=Girardinichthys multiradiatus TaxID=208333 RepID=UPI001FACF12B|nr:low affinity immunoglobulin gamma Fc region receptor II-like isoform X2 [Girardinichthys multiradiatus]
MNHSRHQQNRSYPSFFSLQLIWLQTMKTSVGICILLLAHAASTAYLQVLPNRSQFFQYESVSFRLNCDQQANPAAWRVKRNTSKQINALCPSYFTGRKESKCILNDLYEADTGVYWCESEAGKSSNAINITVTDGELILESPALPVMEGHDLVLRCRTRIVSENLLTKFYKDERFIGSSWTGNITLHSVSKSDEGLYRCYISGAGESPDSWLSVRGQETGPELLRSLHGNIVLPVVVTSVSLFLAMLLCLCRNHQGKCDSSVLMYTRIINRHTCRTKDLLQRGRSSVLSAVVVYRPVLRPGLGSARVQTYKAYRDDRNKQQTFSSLLKTK